MIPAKVHKFKIHDELLTEDRRSASIDNDLMERNIFPEDYPWMKN
jgi:hypothetical protein